MCQIKHPAKLHAFHAHVPTDLAFLRAHLQLAFCSYVSRTNMPYILMCSCLKLSCIAYVLTFQCVLRAYMLIRLRARVSCVLTRLCGNMPCVLTRSRGHVETCLARLLAYLPTCFVCLRAHVL